MNRLIVGVLWVAPAVALATGCVSVDGHARHQAAELRPFKSDGCSMFPDGTMEEHLLWEECCFRHDLAYWQGGTKEERMMADLELRECIEQTTGNASLAEMMYQGVRAGGGAHFPTWYRWGYGWRTIRKNGPLTDDEERMVVERLREFEQHGGGGPPPSID